MADPKPRDADELRAWQSRLGEGTLVMISDSSPEPAEVDIVLGQTVFFAVVKGTGVSITDSSLVASERESGAA